MREDTSLSWWEGKPALPLRNVQVTNTPRTAGRRSTPWYTWGGHHRGQALQAWAEPGTTAIALPDTLAWPCRHAGEGQRALVSCRSRASQCMTSTEQPFTGQRTRQCCRRQPLWVSAAGTIPAGWPGLASSAEKLWEQLPGHKPYRTAAKGGWAQQDGHRKAERVALGPPCPLPSDHLRRGSPTATRKVLFDF